MKSFRVQYAVELLLFLPSSTRQTVSPDYPPTRVAVYSLKDVFYSPNKIYIIILCRSCHCSEKCFILLYIAVLFRCHKDLGLLNHRVPICYVKQIWIIVTERPQRLSGLLGWKTGDVRYLTCSQWRAPKKQGSIS